MTSEKPKVFLIVTIPTHLRVLMTVADLLKADGRYLPYLVYCPSAVYDQNHERCAEAPYPVFLWRNRKFEAIVSAAGPAGLVHPSADMPADPMVESQAPSGRRWRFGSRLKAMLSEGADSNLVPRYQYFPSPQRVVAALGSIKSAVGNALYITFRTVFLSMLIPIAGCFNMAQAVTRLLRSQRSEDSGTPSARVRSTDRNFSRQVLLQAFDIAWMRKSRKVTRRFGLASILERLADGIFGGLSEQKRFYTALSDLLDQEKPGRLILPEENLFYNSHLIVHAAHARHIPVLVVPFTIANSLEWAEAFYDRREFQADRGWNRMLAKGFPHWKLHHNDRVLILPGIYVVGCEYFSIKLDHPWVINSGPAEVICSESQFMSDYYRRSGIRTEKIKLTGALSDDKLFLILRRRADYRQALSHRLGRPIEGTVVLIGLPPDQLVGGRRPGCEFDKYEALTKFMVGTCKAILGEGNTLLISLHPRIKRENVAYLEEMGAIIVAEPVEDLVPLSDLYVSVVSATIRLAISCGIPVLNYDAYQYNYDDYTGLQGVKEVKTRKDYSSALEAYLGDPLAYGVAAAAQRHTAAELCCIDGKAGERLLMLVTGVGSSLREKTGS